MKRGRTIRWPSSVRPWRWLLFACACLLLCDLLYFRYLLWQWPNETAWDTEPLYQFEHRLRRLEADGLPVAAPSGQAGRSALRVVVLGSSVAVYGVLPERLRAELGRGLPREHRREVSVSLLGRQGMHWEQLLPLTSRILALKPDLLIVPTNMVDFRFERPLVLGLAPALEAGGAAREQALAQLARDLYDRPRVRLVSPNGSLDCCWQFLTGDARAQTFLASLSAAYRFGEIAGVPVRTWVSNRRGRGHSYLHYAGVPVGGQNVTLRGRTGAYFSLPVTDRLIRDGLELEAPPEMFARAPADAGPVNIDLRLVAGAASNVRPGESCPAGALRLQWRQQLRPGWQNIVLRGRANRGDALCASLSRTWHSSLQAAQLGVRLARNTGLGPGVSQHARRPLRQEDDRYLNYSNAQYRRSYRARLQSFGRAGMEYLHALERSRQYWSARDFDRDLPSVRAMASFVGRARAAGVPLLLVNSPENPLSFGEHGGGRFFRGYLDNFASLQVACGVGFGDFSRSLKMQYFYDSHHLSYHGAELFSVALAKSSLRFLGIEEGLTGTGPNAWVRPRRTKACL